MEDFNAPFSNEDDRPALSQSVETSPNPNEELDTTQVSNSAPAGVGTFFWEVVRAVVVSLLIIIPVRYFLVQPFFVKGPSMETTFLDGDYVLINELGYRFHTPQRGDVVIFRAPPQPDEHY